MFNKLFRYISSPANELWVQEIVASMDLKKKDRFGPDPFNLRRYDSNRKTKPILDLVKVIEKKSKTKIENSNAQREKNLGEKTVPGYAHIIWVGSEFSTPKHRERALKWKEMTKKNHYQVILWTDRDDFSKAENGEMLEWCQQNNIALLNIADVFSGNSELEEEYQLELMRANWAGVSDIVRELIEERFGGLYSDVDTWPAKEIPLIEIKNDYGLLLNIDAYYEDLRGNATINNDILASIPHAKGVKKIIQTIQELYAMTANEVFKSMSTLMEGSINYATDYPFVDAGMFFKARTMYLAGPVMIREIFGIDPQLKIDTSLFHWRNEGSWYDKNKKNIRVIQKKFPSKYNAFEYILSWILNDLKFEPRVLRLSDYESLLKEFHITDDITKILCQYFPEHLENVEYIRINDLKLSKESFKFFFNPKIFPKIKTDSQQLIGIETAVPNYSFLSSLSNFNKILFNNEFIRNLFENYEEYSKEIESFLNSTLKALNKDEKKKFLNELVDYVSKNIMSYSDIFLLLNFLLNNYKPLLPEIDISDLISKKSHSTPFTYRKGDNLLLQYWLKNFKPSQDEIEFYLIRLCESIKGTDSEKQGVLLLTKTGVDLNHLSNGDSILWLVLKKDVSTANIIKFLIEIGADPTIKNNSGQTLIHVLCSNFILSFMNKSYIDDIYTDKLTLLINNGLDVNAQDKNGISCLETLILTADKNYPAIESLIITFIENGASIDKVVTKSPNKETIFDLLINSDLSENTKSFIMHNHQKPSPL